MRKIPTTMASQHPDHAARPYWHSEEYISTQEEIEECFLSFSDLGISEYKWDWEGKLVEESVLERLFGEHMPFFKEHPLGVDKFLTFRLPNSNAKTEFRMGRALMGVLSAAGLAKQVGLHSPPIFEVILPMVETAEEMMNIEEAFDELTNLKHPLYKLGDGILGHVEIIPLFEQVNIIINSDGILKEYLDLHKTRFGRTPEYLRPYIARSDPALNSGMVPTVIAIKIALSRYKNFEDKHGIDLCPIIGCGSLPFRGGLTPHTVDKFINEYQGVKTALIQSAFRYDYPREDVIAAIKKLETALPLGKPLLVAEDEEKDLIELIPIFENYYRETIGGIADVIVGVANGLPKRRERVKHIGLFGYARKVGAVELPRAIGFTASLYSLGIPPELIGTGRGLKAVKNKGKLELIEKYYLNLKDDILRSGRYLNKKVLERLAKENKIWNGVIEDVEFLEEYLQKELGPVVSEEKDHYAISEEIYSKFCQNDSTEDLIKQAGVLRKSLG